LLGEKLRSQRGGFLLAEINRKNVVVGEKAADTKHFTETDSELRAAVKRGEGEVV
jgi:hypothetical protein